MEMHDAMRRLREKRGKAKIKEYEYTEAMDEVQILFDPTLRCLITACSMASMNESGAKAELHVNVCHSVRIFGCCKAMYIRSHRKTGISSLPSSDNSYAYDQRRT